MAAVSNRIRPEDEAYAMANLSQRMTGLSRVVWVSPRMGTHDVRIKVSAASGKNTLPADAAEVALRPHVRHVAGPALPASVMAEIERWIALNLAPPLGGGEGWGEVGCARKRARRY